MLNTFSLDSEIYHQDLIQQAIQDFVEVTEISFSDNILSVEASSGDEAKEIFLEFCNYILSL